MKSSWFDRFKQVLSKERKGQIDALSLPESWAHLPAQDRQALAEKVMNEGTKLMEEQRPSSEGQAIACFELATKIAPLNGHIFYLQAVAYFQKAQEKRSEFHAEKALNLFKKAVEYAPQNIGARLSLAQAHLFMFELTEQEAQLEEALEICETLEKKKEENLDHLAQLNWVHGRALYMLGLISEEPLEFQKSLSKLREAKKLGMKEENVNFDLANVTLHLGLCIGRMELLEESLNRFKEHLKRDPNHLDAIQKYAQINTRLFYVDGDRSYAVSAIDAYEVWHQLEKSSWRAFLNLCRLRLSLSRITRDMGQVEKVLDLLRAYDPPEKHKPDWDLIRAQAYILKGSHAERYDLIKAALDDLIELEDEMREDPIFWGTKGRAHLELGRYFEDIEPIFDSLECFQKGLLVEGETPDMWLGFAEAYYTYGLFANDVHAMKKAAQLYAQAQSCGKLSHHFWVEWGVCFLKLAEHIPEKDFVILAIEKFEEALKLLSREGEEPDDELLYHYGCALDFMGDLSHEEHFYRKSMHLLTVAHDKKPSSEKILYNLAVSTMHYAESVSEMDAFIKADGYYKQLIQGDPEDDQVWNEWGTCLVHMAQLSFEANQMEVGVEYLKGAKDKLMRAAQLGSLQSFYNLACVSSLQGDVNMGLRFLAKAIEVGVTPPKNDLLEDEWIEKLKETPEFTEMVENLEEYPEDSSDEGSGGLQFS